MTMYRSLLLHADGGIIDVSQQAEQDNAAVLCIGLGGTGVDALRNLKAKIYNRVRPDDPSSGAKQYSHIKFLAVDIDKAEFDSVNSHSSAIERLDPDQEFFDLSYQFSHSYRGSFSQYCREHANDPCYREWFRYADIKALRGDDYWWWRGAVRQLGRFFLIFCSHKFKERLLRLVAEARIGLMDAPTYVHIFSGVSGNTGGGIFLDVSYIVRDAFPEARTCGYFFLPDVNISKGLPPTAEACVRVNGYAALQELDYCMNFERNGDSWHQQYQFGEIASTRTPVDVCHLVTARDSAGNVLDDAYEYAMNVVTDYVMDFVVRSQDLYGEQMALRRWFSQIEGRMQHVAKSAGASYEYLVLGGSVMTLPFKEVLTYLASEMFTVIDSVDAHKVTDADVDEFVKGNGLTYESLFSELTAGVQFEDFDRPDVKWRQAQGYGRFLIYNNYNVQRAVEDGKLKTHGTQMGKSFSDGAGEPDYTLTAVDGTALAHSVSYRLIRAVNALAVSAQYGPVFAVDVLNGSQVNSLVAKLNGYLRTLNGDRATHASQLNLRNSEVSSAKKDFENYAGWPPLQGQSKFDVYCSKYDDLVRDQIYIKAYDELENVINSVLADVKAYAKFLALFRDTIGNLSQTFDQNRKDLAGTVLAKQGYEIRLASIQELKPNLDATIRQMNLENCADDFLQLMYKPDAVGAWAVADEGKIASVVTEYFTDLFSEYSHKTMTSYLEDKFGVTNKAQLAARVQESILAPMDRNASPLFWPSSGYSIDDAAIIGYVSYPQVATEVGLAIQNLAASRTTGSFDPRPSTLTDRISMMRLAKGVPMFGYSELQSCEKAYAGGHMAVGVHLYEGKQYVDDSGAKVKGRDWRLLPSPIPFSKSYAGQDDYLVKWQKSAAALYDKAESAGVIVKSAAGEWNVVTIPEETISQIKEIQTQALAPGAGNAAKQAAKQRIDWIVAHAKRNAIAAIPSDAQGAPPDCPTLPESNQRIVRVDHFVKAPKLQETVQKECDVLERVPDS
ncbi:MAG: tubulin-like doman-containing protein [Bifidobacterium tibiigranuli]|jgi:hypothetical protein|uniref:tubulin-like doman-containing protein n=1 Tax=Bifidobacterium tibiigranuli TaxID=2172043 RepID=UPI0026F30F00|nr:tubulin-like doman-containing protein [Bifidobacterium tibiigranuli]MCI1649200.1 tubulin-like doman-containing protein [Bifidobacterium tibiigranuli]MCI2185618.1 tubulin-like doman-containing protein [Bifidobacterium tibiigranuli]